MAQRRAVLCGIGVGNAADACACALNMQRIACAGACIAILCAQPPAASAENPPPDYVLSSIVTLEDWGIYAGAITHDEPAAGTTRGAVAKTIRTQTLLRTRVVCAQLGTMFGVKVRLNDGLPARNLGISNEIDHPPLINMRGEKQNRDVYDSIIYAGRPGWSGWVFRDPGELAAGRWIFIMRRAGTILLRQSFDIRLDCTKPVA